MTSSDTDFETPEMVEVAANAAGDKLGSDIVIIDVADVIGITEQFVLISGTNSRQVRAIAEEIDYQVKQAGGPAPERTEGMADLEWVLLDYGYFIVHVFHEDARGYFQLERLWGDRPRKSWEPAAV